MTVQLKESPSLNAVNPLKHAAGLSAVWQKCLSEVYGSECRLLTNPEHGKLKRLKESLGMKRATEVVEYAIRNWGKFAVRAAMDVHSDMFPPEKPSVGWLCKYHATALLMLQEELQSIAKEQADEEQAKKEAHVKEAAKAIQELKAKEPAPILLKLTSEQFDALLNEEEDPANEAWAERVRQKYGEFTPSPNGIPCEVELTKAA